MKTLITVISILSSIGIFAQNNDLKLISISGQGNLNLWIPLDEDSKTFKENGGKINVYTWKASVGVTLFRTKSYPLRIGMSYMKISHTVVDRIKSLTYANYYTNDLPQTYIFNDPMDLRSRSRNLGVFAEPMWKIVHAKKSVGLIGLNASVYFIEFYKSRYVTADINLSAGEQPAIEAIQPLVQENQKKFGVSSSSLEFFYLHSFNLKPNFSLGLRASVGANLYSNWDQFKRYIWAGVGVELGFGGSRKESKVE